VTARGFDIAVIGGGAIGLAVARALRRAGARIAVIDAGAQTPPASMAAAGMLAPSFELAAGAMGEALYELGARSLARWPEFAAALEEETGLNVDYRDDGALAIALDEARAAALAEHGAALSRRGGTAKLLSGAEARVMEPALSPRMIAALFAPQDAQADAPKLLAALRASFEKSGGTRIAASVQGVKEEGAHYVLSLSTGAALGAEKIVLAAGARAPAVARMIEGLAPPPVFPVKGEALALAAPASLLHRVVRGPGAYLCPKAGGRLVVGASEVPYRDDLDVDAHAIQELKEAASAAVPEAGSLREIDRWAGLRPATPDAAPILGRCGKGPDNVYLALGHYRNGILLAPETAAALAEEIATGAPLAHLQAFRPDRFAKGVD
jgi:glycine oxidase